MSSFKAGFGLREASDHLPLSPLKFEGEFKEEEEGAGQGLSKPEACLEAEMGNRRVALLAPEQQTQRRHP